MYKENETNMSIPKDKETFIMTKDGYNYYLGFFDDCPFIQKRYADSKSTCGFKWINRSWDINYLTPNYEKAYKRIERCLRKNKII